MPEQSLSVAQRARITIPDVLFILMTLAIMAALWPVFADLLDANAGTLDTGQTLLFSMFLPLALLVIFYIVYTKAIRGLRL